MSDSKAFPVLKNRISFTPMQKVHNDIVNNLGRKFNSIVFPLTREFVNSVENSQLQDAVRYVARNCEFPANKVNFPVTFNLTETSLLQDASMNFDSDDKKFVLDTLDDIKSLGFNDLPLAVSGAISFSFHPNTQTRAGLFSFSFPLDLDGIDVFLNGDRSESQPYRVNTRRIQIFGSSKYTVYHGQGNTVELAFVDLLSKIDSSKKINPYEVKPADSDSTIKIPVTNDGLYFDTKTLVHYRKVVEICVKAESEPDDIRTKYIREYMNLDSTMTFLKLATDLGILANHNDGLGCTDQKIIHRAQRLEAIFRSTLEEVYTTFKNVRKIVDHGNSLVISVPKFKGNIYVRYIPTHDDEAKIVFSIRIGGTTQESNSLKELVDSEGWSTLRYSKSKANVNAQANSEVSQAPTNTEVNNSGEVEDKTV